MLTFPITDAWIKEQLADTPGRPNMFQMASNAYGEMRLAMATEGTRGAIAVQAAGVFGGLVRKWKAGVLAHLTKDILVAHAIDASRERVRAIQFDIFGRAQASKDLKQYATKIRNGGGRARPMPEIPDEVKVAALKFYQEHQDELKLAVHGSQG